MRASREAPSPAAAGPTRAAATPARALVAAAPGFAVIQRALHASAVGRDAVVQRRGGCACGGGGSCHCHDDEGTLPRPPLQTRLTINAPGDEYELEAERTADLMTRMPGRPDAPAIAAPSIRPYVQRHASEPASTAGGPLLEDRLGPASHGGEAIHDSVRAPLEERFGVDFGGVRVHTGPAAAALSDALGAAAFTHGRDIYFAQGMYEPGGLAGRRLLAHELTHVVQQGGGAADALQPRRGAIQRALNVETKWYYFGPLSGKSVHEAVESRLLEDGRNKNLIVEAPIPGAVRDPEKVFRVANPDYFERVGRADLYTSEHSGTGAVIGVRGHHDAEELKKSYDQRRREYRDLRTGGVRTAKGGPRWTPSVTAGKITGTFPGTFKVADLKPLSVTKAGEGCAQIANYIEGLGEFVDQARADGAVSQTHRTKGAVLNDLQIPEGLDYWHLDGEPPGRPGPGHFIVGNQRCWVARGTDSGLYYYFWLNDPPPTKAARQKQEKVLAALEPVRKGLTFHEGGPASTVQFKRRPARAGALPKVLQRSPVNNRPVRDWAAEGKAWEEKRAAWDTGVAKPFLKTAEAKAIEQRADTEKHLQGGASSSFAPDARGFRSIELWQGATGIGLGKIRFLLGGTFDKVVGFYERIHERFKGWHARLHGVDKERLKPGWPRRLGQVLLTAVKIGFSELLKGLWAYFAACIQGILNKVVRAFTEDISEELHKRVEKLHQKFEQFATRFKEEFESRFGSWDRFIGVLTDISRWAGIASDVLTLTRLVAQGIACLSPPLFGCLWGLVAQLAIEEILDLAIGSEPFERRVVRPTVRNLISRFAGPAYQSLLDGSLELVGLTDFAANVSVCHRDAKKPEKLIEEVLQKTEEEREKLEGKPLDGDDLLQHREQWDRKNRGKMEDAYDRIFGKKGKRTPPAGAEESLDPILEAEGTGAQQKIRERLGWPDQSKVDAAWTALDRARPDLVNDEGQPVSGGDLVELADVAATAGLEGAQVQEAIESAPKGAGGKRQLGDVSRKIRERAGGAGTEPRQRAGPGLSIRKRFIVPNEPGLPAGVGPQVFGPPPGHPEQTPSVVPGKVWRF